MQDGSQSFATWCYGIWKDIYCQVSVLQVITSEKLYNNETSVLI